MFGSLRVPMAFAGLAVLPAAALAAKITISGFGVTVTVDCADLTISGGMSCQELCNKIDDSWFTSCTYNSNGSVSITTLYAEESVVVDLEAGVVVVEEGSRGTLLFDAEDADVLLWADDGGLSVTAETDRGESLGRFDAPFEVQLSAKDGIVLTLDGTEPTEMKVEVLPAEAR